MKFLIAGLGSIGRRHLRNLLALGEKDIVLFRTHLGTLGGGELEGFPVETDLQAALARRPDAVIVSNPTALHLDVAIPAAEAGACLLIEKPVSHTLERIADLRSAVRRGGGQVLVGYHFRHHPGLQMVKQLLDRDEIGALVSFRAHWGEYLPDWHPWEGYREGYSARRDLGGGAVLTLSHPLDYTRWLLGDPTDLWAFTSRGSELGLDVEEAAEIGLRLAGGASGSIHLDYLQQPPRHHLEIICAGGTLLWDADANTTRLYRREASDWEIFPSPQGFERNHLFLAEMGHFLDVASGRADPICSLDDGVRALELALAALLSAEEGKLVKF